MSLNRAQPQSEHRLHVSVTPCVPLFCLSFLYGTACAETAIVLNSVDENVSFVDTRTYKETGRAPACKEPHQDRKSVV